MINKIIKELRAKAEYYSTNPIFNKPNMTTGVDKCMAYCDAISIVENYEVNFHNYEMYSDLLEENEKLKEELKLSKEASLNSQYWEVNQLFMEECIKTADLREELKKYNDKWVLCSEVEIPEKIEEFFATTESGHVYRIHPGLKPFKNDGSYIAWMPIGFPQPYKGEQIDN